MHRRHGLAAGERARRPARPTARPTVPSAPAVSHAGYAWAMAEQDDETYRDQAGRRRRWHLASPEEREARDAQARQLRGAGLSYREIAQQLGCGRGTVARAVRNAPPPNRIIRGERVDGRPVVTIDGHPFAWHDAPDVTEWSPTGIEWGHFGAGSRRLAFTILLAVTDRPRPTSTILGSHKAVLRGSVQSASGGLSTPTRCGTGWRRPAR